jgi:hypothetical protein
MQKYHLIDTGEVVPAAPTHILYGRLIATVLKDGKVLCDNHLFCLDTDSPPDIGETLMIWRDHDCYCCKVSEYEKTYRH